MNKQIFKVFFVTFICLIFITSFCLSASAYSYPPYELVDYTMPGFTGQPFHYNDLLSSYDVVAQLFTMDSSGHPYYWEWYFDNIAVDVTFCYHLLSSYDPCLEVNFHNSLSSTQTIMFRYFVYDGANGSLIWDRNYGFIWSDGFRAVTSRTLSPNASTSIYIRMAHDVDNLLYIRPYCNLVSYRVPSTFLGVLDSKDVQWLSFDYLINGQTPSSPGGGGGGSSSGSASGSTSGSASGSYDSSSGDINVDVNLEQDYSPLIDYGDSEDVPSISDSSADEFESAVSDLPTIQDSDLDTVFENYDFDNNNSAIRWIYSMINTLFNGNQKVFSVLLSFLVLSLLMLILNKRGQ